MPYKIFISITFILITYAFLSFSTLSTSMKRRVAKNVPEKVKSVFKEPNYYAETPNYIKNDSVNYYNQKNNFSNFKKRYKNQYLKATTAEQKSKILMSASDQLYNTLADSLIPFWYSTPWGYNGISQKPGKGKIACGYFVFTLLRDAGIKLPRIKMSQAASEQAIKSLVAKSQIKRFSNVSINDFVTKMNTWGNGFYIIGLDNHIGLIQVKGKETWFIHSTVIYPSCVIKEKASTSPALQLSAYRVVGKLSNQNTLTKKWLLNEYIPLM